MKLVGAAVLLAAPPASADVTLVHPPQAVSGETVSVRDFRGMGAIEPIESGTAEIALRGLFLFVDAVDGADVNVDVAITDPADPFLPLKRFEPNSMIGPDERYGQRGDVIFSFLEGVDGFMGFRFSADGGQSYQYGWVEFHWGTRLEAGTPVDFFVVQRAAWRNDSGKAIRAGEVQGGMVEMVVDFEGTISDGSDLANTLGFGAGAGALNGRTIRGSFVYAADAAPPDIAIDENETHHLSELPESSAWFLLPTLHIDGEAVPVPDFSLVSPPDPSAVEDFSEIRLRDRMAPEADGLSYFRFRAVNDGHFNLADYTLQIDVSGDATLIDSADLSEPFELNSLDKTTQVGFIASVSTLEGFEILVNDVTLTHMTATPVGVPKAVPALSVYGYVLLLVTLVMAGSTLARRARSPWGIHVHKSRDSV